MPQLDDNDIQDLDSSPGSETLDAKAKENKPRPKARNRPLRKTAKRKPKDHLVVVRDVVDKKGRSRQRRPRQPKASETANRPATRHPKSRTTRISRTSRSTSTHAFSSCSPRSKTYEADASDTRTSRPSWTQRPLGAGSCRRPPSRRLGQDESGAGVGEVKPWVQNLLIAAGEVLPDDLNQRVTGGELSREAALELSRRGHRSSRAKHSRRSSSSAPAQEPKRTRRASSDTEGWEADRQTKDPNFAAKQPASSGRSLTSTPRKASRRRRKASRISSSGPTTPSMRASSRRLPRSVGQQFVL
jgi:hypothetical protein